MRKVILAAIAISLPIIANAQGAMDVYKLSQQNLNGSARFMSMAGAFGALGGDLSVVNQNPGGIGVYRSSDIGMSFNVDMQSTQAESLMDKYGSLSQTKVRFSQAGYIGSYNLGSESLQNINWGFTYNRTASFNRRYAGGISSLGTSLTNYIAAISAGCDIDKLAETESYNPYNDMNNNSPWLSILAYNSFLINPVTNQGGPSQTIDTYYGLYGNGTTGRGEFETLESGGIDEYTFSIGGNVYNLLYWGLSAGITDINYNAETYYGESLQNAHLQDKDFNPVRGSANWGLVNSLRTSGSGYNLKLGLILKPINELRLGFAFHTPTYYSLKDEVYTVSSYEYSTGISGSQEVNPPYGGASWYKIKTPWRFIASAATVLGGRGILSVDYEYVGYNTMEMSSESGLLYADTKDQINQYFKASSIIRIGGEFRVTPQFSVRAGYSYQSSPVRDELFKDQVNIVTASTTPAYTLDKETQYITAGLGYKFGSFYADMAYIHKNHKSEYHAFTPIVMDGQIVEPSPKATITDNNNQLTFTLGFRF